MTTRQPRTFKEIREKYNLTVNDLLSLKDEVDQVLAGVLKDAGAAQGLTWDHILTLEGLGEKSIQNLTAAIEKSKERPLARILFALGILHVGAEVAGLLTQRYSDLDGLAQAGLEELTEIPGIGPKIAGSIVDYFQVPNNRQVMERLLQAGVKLRQETRPETTSDLPWADLTFVVTGTLSAMSRREAETKVKALGGHAASSVTGKTDYLVAGESPGSKLNAATRLGTQVLDETAFLEMLESAGAPAG